MKLSATHAFNCIVFRVKFGWASWFLRPCYWWWTAMFTVQRDQERGQEDTSRQHWFSHHHQHIESFKNLAVEWLIFLSSWEMATVVCALTLAFYVFLRTSEFTSSNLLWSDIQLTSTTVTILPRQSKTNSFIYRHFHNITSHIYIYLFSIDHQAIINWTD